MLNVTICIGNTEIADTFMNLSEIGTERFGRDFSNFANHAATKAAFHFAGFRTSNGSTITKTVYVHFGDKPPICFPAQIDFSAPGNMVEVLDKFRSELAQSLRETFAYAIVYLQNGLEG